MDLDEVERRAIKMKEASVAASHAPWLQPIDDERRAIVGGARPGDSLLSLDRDGMAIFAEERDADFAVIARNIGELLALDVLALVAEVRALRSRLQGRASRRG